MEQTTVFSVGQLVTLKALGIQLRILAASKRGYRFAYMDGWFTAEELEAK
jgi:hypothetical protein